MKQQAIDSYKQALHKLNGRPRLGSLKQQAIDSYKQALHKLNEGELLELELRNDNKERNYELIKKIYWWFISVVGLGIISSSIVLLQNSKLTNELLHSYFSFIYSFILLMIIMLVLIQSVNNLVYNQKKLMELEKNGRNDKKVDSNKLD